jgi:hypothetical protein
LVQLIQIHQVGARIQPNLIESPGSKEPPCVLRSHIFVDAGLYKPYKLRAILPWN